MSNDPVFDPIFNMTPVQEPDRLVPERTSYHFDGWSYEPLAVDQAQTTRVLAPQRKAAHALR